MTRPAVNRLIYNNLIRKNLLTILERLRKNAPIIFCTGEPIFHQLMQTDLLKNFNVQFQRKIGMKWFNYHLEKKVSQYLIK